MKKLDGDEAFYLKHVDGKLKGMILLHVDDFLIGGDEDFVETVTKLKMIDFDIMEWTLSLKTAKFI